MSGLADKLSSVLADAATFYFRAHAAHWNVMGDDFQQFHELFGEIYEDVWGSLDPIAENIRKIDAFPPSSLDEIMAKRETGPKHGAITDSQDLLADLIPMNDEVINCLVEAFAEATSANEQGVANFLADRIDMHQKWRWQMKASVENEAPDVSAEKPAPQKPKIAPRKKNPALDSVAPVTVRPPAIKVGA